MRKLLSILFLFCYTFIQAQYGNQTPLTISGITGLLHLPDTYNTDPPTQKYPLLIMWNGAGEYGTDPAKATVHGVGWAIKNNKWNPDSVENPVTHQIEKFITLSCLNPSNNSGPQLWQTEAVIDWMITHYRVDTTVKGLTGLSRGGGVSTGYAFHIDHYNWNTSPPTPVFFTPKHIPTAIVVASSETNVYDPVKYFVQDSGWIWGWGDLSHGDIHAVTTKANVDSVNKYTNPDRGIFTTFICDKAGANGHCGWDTALYDASVTKVVDGISMNIYQYFLYKRRGTVAPPVNSISVSGIPTAICVKKPSGATITVHFNSVGSYTGNTYTAQLSDKNGLFSSAIDIGSLTTNVNSGDITATVPFAIPAGSGYRIRVNSNNPAVVGSDNGSNITITVASNSVSPSSSQTIPINTNATQLTVTEGSPSLRGMWYDGNTPLGITAKTYIPNFSSVGSHSLSYHSVFSCDSVISNSVNITVVNPSPSRIYINSNGGGTISLNGCNGSFKYNHGDTLVFRANLKWSRIELHCIDSVVVINEGGQVDMGDDYGGGNTVILPGGFILDNCQRIHLTGTGTPGVIYGFLDTSNNNRGVGVQIVGASKHIEVDHLEIAHRNAGFWDKTEQLDNKCIDSLAFPQLVMNDHKLHDNYIHNILNEGFYVGPTAPNSNDTSINNQHPKVYCPNGDLNTTLTARMGNIWIYNNIIDSTGRGGIQLSSADSGTNLIFGNTVTRSGYSGEFGQGNGIVLGGYTHADIYNNIVRSTTSAPIFLLGSGLSRVYNNIIDSAGIKRTGVTLANTPSIEIDTRNTTNPSPGHPNPELTTFQVYDNTVLKKTGNFNIVIDKTYDTYAPSGSYICNSGNVTNFYNVPYDANCGITPTITTGNLPNDSFCVTKNFGTSFKVGFQSVGTYNTDNIYKVQLSNANGSFASPVIIGTLTSNKNIDSIPVTIPLGTASGNGYKLKVISTSPSVIGSSTPAFTITLASNSISPATEQDIDTGTNGDTITVTETTLPISRKWYANDSLLAYTGTTYVPNFPYADTFIIKCVSTFKCGIVESNTVTIIVTDPTPPPPQTISISSLSDSVFCIKKDSGANFSVQFTSVGIYNKNNKYKVKLSAKNGSFSSSIVIGYITSNANSGTIPCIIPSGLPTGTNYRIKVVSTNPIVKSSVSTTKLNIKLADNNIFPTTSQSILESQNGDSIFVNEPSVPNSRQWYANNQPIAGATSNFYIPNFDSAGTYIINCHSLFPCGEIVSNSVQVTVNSIPLPPPPDTICITNHNWQHDTINVITVHKTVSVPVITESVKCKIVFWFLKLGCETVTDTSYVDSSYDSSYTIIVKTPPHDTIICTINPAVKFGTFYFDPFNTVPLPDVIDTVKNYIGTKYMRYNFNRGGGSVYTNNVPIMLDSGLKVILTANNDVDGSPGFDNFIDSLMQLGRPEILCIRNEPIDNSTSIVNVIKDMSAAIPVAHSYGVKVADGGITKGVVYYMARYWNTHGKSDSAQWLINTLHLDTTSTLGRNLIARYDTLFNGLDTLAVDYVNFHFYEPTATDTTVTTVSGLLPIVANFLLGRLPGKQLISNEFGTHNHSCGLLTSLTQEAIDSHFKYLVYFDGNGTNAIKNQDCFKDIIKNF